MPYHGDDGSNLRIHPGYRKNGGYPNFVIMASQLLVEYSWLVGVILVSILLRVDNNRRIPSVSIHH